MIQRHADARWDGDLKGGSGTIELQSGAYRGSYSFASRFEQGKGTNPEELIAAAHAGCFSMAFAHTLAQQGFPPTHVHTTATVHLESAAGGFRIPQIDLVTEADVPNISEALFLEKAEEAKRNCPVSKVLSGAEITLKAELIPKSE